MVTKAKEKANELIEKFGKNDAARTAHAFACSVSRGKKDFWRKVKEHIAESG